MVEELVKIFDEIIIVPCGPRPDKETTNDILPIHRAVMADLAFGGIPKVAVDLSDLELAEFTRTWELQEKYQNLGEIWHVIGTDLTDGGNEGKSFIQREWVRGSEIWEKFNFAVFQRDSYDDMTGFGAYGNPKDFPPHSEVIHFHGTGSSSNIREKIFKRQSTNDLMHPKVHLYISRYDLYRGVPPRKQTRLVGLRDKVGLYLNSRPTLASAPLVEKMKTMLGAHLTETDPEIIVTVGGDGTMLHAIRENWRKRLPFFGINAGRRGFLMNELDPEITLWIKLSEELVVEQIPLLYVEYLGADEKWRSTLACNDAWVERSSGQTAWLQIDIDGKTRIPRMVSDGALVATAQGSTAYARAMGASPLLVGTRALILVGNNVMEPPIWKMANISLQSNITFINLGGDKRPIEGFADGESLGQIKAMKIRTSRIAAAELAFLPHRDMTEKLAELQFPK